MGGGASTSDFRYMYPIDEKKDGETNIYKHDCMKESDPDVGLEYENLDTIKGVF
jgi:hypothetical protein